MKTSTKAVTATNERILAVIIANQAKSGRRASRGSFGIIGRNLDYPKDCDGPACAVGLGCLYAGLGLIADERPERLFAKVHRVSLAYAMGVSDGFEGISRSIELYPVTFDIIVTECAEDDYQEGRSVGAAAADAFDLPAGVRWRQMAVL